jgi:hypothetical protein
VSGKLGLGVGLAQKGNWDIVFIDESFKIAGKRGT